MNASKYRILIADDHPLFRRGLVDWFDRQHDIDIVAEAQSADECIAFALRLRPDLIIVDPQLGGFDDHATLARLRGQLGAAPIVVLTSSTSASDVARALEAGAVEYLTKDMHAGDLLAAVRHVLSATDGGAHARRLLASDSRQAAGTQPPCAALTDRERQVLALVGTGMPNKLIARTLDISEGTVKVHLRNMKRKIGYRSRVEIALWARRAGKLPIVQS